VVGAAVTVAVVLGTFIVYSTWAAMQNAHYYARRTCRRSTRPVSTVRARIQPSAGGCRISISRDRPPLAGVPDPLGPGLFRLTCYYYRKAYYRSFWLAPPACAVPDAKRGYTGETRFPLILQAFHRYTWYVAVLFIVMLTWDALLALKFPNGFGIGVGTIVMWINVLFLAAYTFSCHSCRHVCGGHLDVFSKAPARYRVWHFLTRLNERHPLYACSRSERRLTDLYIRLVSMGVIRDLRII